jgi:uncharacterized protein YdhG (YjbR/CyaY superfamily)
MERVPKQPVDIDDYIATRAPDVRSILRRIRATIRKAAPKAEERISYRMPAFFQDGAIVYFAAFKQHVGLFPPARGDTALEKAVARYAGPKGNLQFPLNQPIPYALIARIARHRFKANKAKSASKRTATRLRLPVRTA